MANTYTLINSTSLSSSAASVTFSAIPATFDDLILEVSGKTDGSTTYGSYSVYLEFNANTSTIYSDTNLWVTWDGSSDLISSDRNSGTSFVRFPYTGEANPPSNVFGSLYVYIPAYRVSQNKPLSAFGVTERNSSQIDGIDLTAGLFRSTAAITELKIKPAGSIQWVSGSTFWLYGIKNS